jgi:hypothetical protein
VPQPAPHRQGCPANIGIVVDATDLALGHWILFVGPINACSIFCAAILEATIHTHASKAGLGGQPQALGHADGVTVAVIVVLEIERTAGDEAYPRILAASAAALMAVAAIAVFFRRRRAAPIDPMSALRWE